MRRSIFFFFIDFYYYIQLFSDQTKKRQNGFVFCTPSLLEERAERPFRRGSERQGTRKGGKNLIATGLTTCGVLKQLTSSSTESGVLSKSIVVYLCWCVLPFKMRYNCLLLSSILSGALWSVARATTNKNASANTIISYPLTPHHVHQMRRRKLMTNNAYESAVENNNSWRRVDESSSATSVRRRDVAQQVGALYQGYGTHYVDLWCGSPPQRQTVIVDTGSGVTAFPCSGCHNCGVPSYHIDELFQEDKSTTFQHNTCSETEGACVSSRSRCTSGECKISMAYAEGSRWDAFEAIDNCYIGGPHEMATQDDGASDDLDPNHVLAFDLIFGCQTSVTGLFRTQLADGIMGMDARSGSFWAQMFEAGRMGKEKKFSLCFSSSPTAERKGTEAGALTLGGKDERFDTSPTVYTPRATGGRDGFFSVHVRRVYLRDGSAGESANSSKPNPSEGTTPLEVSEAILNTGGVIVDSGTTDTYWNKGISQAFKKAFQEVAGRPYTNSPLSLTHDELLALPTILIQLESSEEANHGSNAYKTTGLTGALDPKNPFDVVLAFPPSHYMEYDEESGQYTPRFYVTESRGSVLGANAMMGHNILFDNDEDRIGWAESDCDYTKLVTSNGYDFSITGELMTPPPVESPVTPPPTAASPNSQPSSDDQPFLPPAQSPMTKRPQPVQSPVSMPTSTLTIPTDEMKKNAINYIQSCKAPECQIPVAAGSLIFLCTALCLCYLLIACCCCRKKHKYTVPTADAGLELSAFRDELSDDEDVYEDEYDDEYDEDSGCDDEPKQEFEGDFI